MRLIFQQLVIREKVGAVEAAIGCLACVALPTLLRLILAPGLGNALPFTTYFPAVLLATMVWGFRWGTVVLIGSGTVAGWLFLNIDQVGWNTPKGLAALGLFILAGAIILATGSTLRTQMRRLHEAREADTLRKSELQHRLKNTLAIVQSFAFYLSKRTSTPEQFYQLLEVRLHALAKASGVLFAERFEKCALPETAREALAPFAMDDRIHMSGPPVNLDANSCEPLMLALHELATNAHKYGALSVAKGHVEVVWTVRSKAPARCVLSWVECDGPLVHAPTTAGLGQRLLTRQNGLEDVEREYRATGLVCTLTLALA
jgi:two-component sensor histidine kinase